MRFAVQTLRRSPGFVLAVVATLALGIGANGGVFSVVQGVLLEALPYDRADRLVHVDDYRDEPDAEPRGLTPARYLALRDRSRTLESTAAVAEWGVSLGEGEGGDFASAAFVAPDLFPLLGVEPELGRAFAAADAEPGAEDVAILQHTLWKVRYGGDADVVGRRIDIDGRPVRVVGVLGEDTFVPFRWTEVVLPLRLDARARADRESRSLGVWARLASGETLASARAELEALSEGLARTHGRTDSGWVLSPRPLLDRMGSARTRRGVVVMAVAVGLLLILACANLASLLLARGLRRQGELAVRTALGASPGQLMRQLLAEVLVLVLLAAPFALWVTWAVVEVARSFPPPSLRYVAQVIRFDAPVVAFVGALSLGTVALFGLGPALRGARVDAWRCLAEGGSRSTTTRDLWGRKLLVVGQIALAVALLVSAQLATQGLENLRRVDPGFRPEGLHVASFRVPSSRYPGPAQRRELRHELAGRLERSPELDGVALVNFAPFSFVGPKRDFEIPSQPRRSGGETPQAIVFTPTPEYLDLLRIPVRRGRGFLRRDRDGGEPVALVNEALARRHFGDQAPVGKSIRLDGRERRIVGVIGDVRHWGPAGPVDPAIYVPYDQVPPEYVTVLAASRSGSGGAGRALRAALHDVDPHLPAVSVASMAERMEIFFWQGRFFSAVIGSLAGLALTLAVFGVYGVASYSVAARRRELGIRSALGATPLSLTALVGAEFAGLGAAGIVVGLCLALLSASALTRVMSLLDPWDPGLFALSAVVLLVAALAGCAVPASRAAFANPRESLEA